MQKVDLEGDLSVFVGLKGSHVLVPFNKSFVYKASLECIMYNQNL